MDWWENFFEGDWDHVHAKSWTHDQTAEQVSAIERFLRIDGPAEILDVPCGIGRHSIELASRGHAVVGVERAANLLDIASAVESTVTWEHRDMRDLPWQDTFDAAFCFWGSFGYFDDSQNFAFLNAVARTLKPGGRFLLDTHVTETILPKFNPQMFQDIDGVTVLHNNWWDHESGRIEGDWTYIRPDGNRTKNHVSIRLYTYRELTELCEDAGFSSFEAWSTLDGTPFALGGSRLYLVATK